LLGGGGSACVPRSCFYPPSYAGRKDRSAIRLAAVVELLHSATLIHDDVIDSADTRRAPPFRQLKMGQSPQRPYRRLAVTCSRFRWHWRNAISHPRHSDRLDPENGRRRTDPTRQKSGRIDVTEEDALRLATYKTACLFSGCARLGAVLGGLEGKEEQALADYGRYAGLAFQLVDDLLDFTASAEQLGKPVLSDLKEGKVTLPLIYAMENGHRDARGLVARVLAEKEFNSCAPKRSFLSFRNPEHSIALARSHKTMPAAPKPASMAAPIPNTLAPRDAPGFYPRTGELKKLAVES